MADLFLTWDEAQGEQLPHYCVSCAAPATEWADWRICNSQHRVFSIEYTYVDVTLPVCPKHRSLSWLFLPRIVARKIHEDGVVLSHVSPGFVEAVGDYREEMEAQEPPVPSRHFAPAPRSHLVEEDFDEFDEVLSASHARQRSPQARYHQTPAGWSAGKIVLMIFLVMLFAPCTLILVVALLGLIFR